MSIIIVDDNIEVCTALESILLHEGFVVRSCINPMNVFEMIQQRKPKLLITDLMMSGIDGTEIVKSVKTQHKTSDIKVVTMSALPNAQDISINCGADGHIRKPFDIDDLVEKVKFFLQ